MASGSAIASPGVTLKPSSISEEAANALPQLVQRIATERDGLKNVTEVKLRQEIAEEAAGLSKGQVDDEVSEDRVKDTALQQKELWAAKNELVRFLDQARNPIALALDTTSFHLRDHAPQQAEQTLSPFIKQNFKQGALGLDRLKPEAKSKADLESDEVTSMGWSLQNLRRSADSLLESARRLNKEVERETRYWQGVSEVKKKGWSISRIPRQRNTVGVKFGFSEAGPLFQSRGHAALRANEDGDIILDRGHLREHKAVHVFIMENGRKVAESRNLHSRDASSEIESRIRDARDSLFEEELFHEMTSEARNLLAYNVKIIEDAIHVPLPSPGGSSTREIVISLAEPHFAEPDADARDTNWQASSIALICRILLTNVYRQRFRKRSSPPPPLSDNKKKSEEPSHILQALLNFIHHRAATENLHISIKSISDACNACGVKFQQTVVRSDETKSKKGFTPMEVLVDSITRAHTTVQDINVQLDSISSTPLTLTLQVHTLFSSPAFGTSFDIAFHTGSHGDDSSNSQPAHFTQIEPFTAYIRQKICLHVASQIARLSRGWKQLDAMSSTLQKASQNGPHGEETAADVQLLSISLQKGRLLLVGKETAISTPRILAMWPGAGPQPTLLETVSSI
ncbi:MAG: hypothetical protein Q9162_002514 [Coniocarpon cinnabarinum]